MGGLVQSEAQVVINIRKVFTEQSSVKAALWIRVEQIPRVPGL